MKRLAALSLILFLLAAGQPAYAQQKMTLTLEKSLSLALSQNPFYLASQERVEGAQSRLRQAAAQFFPSLNASALQNLDEKVFVLEFPSFIPGGQPQRVAVDFTRDYQVSISFNLPLFTGGRLTSGFRQAQYNLCSTRESVRQTNQETVFNVKQGFYGYLLAVELVEVSEEALNLAEKLLQHVRNMVEVGMASRLDLLRAEVRVANLKPSVLQARNNVAVAELSLKTILGLDLSQPVEVVGEMAYQPVEVNLDESLRTALANRPELNQVEYQKKMAEEMVKIARAASLPTIAVSGNYNYWADHLNFRKDTWQNFYAFNLVLNIPVFNGFSASAQVAEARARIREIEHTEKGIGEGIKFEVESALLTLNQARESLLSQEKNIEQAQESVRVAELNYTEGLATILDVDAAQVALSEARINYLRALYEYTVSLALLEKAMGLGWKPLE
ncbi:MAG: TolC family protein [Candidatus Aminicenantes bacterium]|nr:TolC family protein [Candidatus Aminicenantes bacterium]